MVSHSRLAVLGTWKGSIDQSLPCFKKKMKPLPQAAVGMDLEMQRVVNLPWGAQCNKYDAPTIDELRAMYLGNDAEILFADPVADEVKGGKIVVAFFFFLGFNRRIYFEASSSSSFVVVVVVVVIRRLYVPER